MIKVSVIVPVYNVEKYLDKCLKSLVNQTLNDIEIIVVNDGSPDNSQKIIDKYNKKYPKLVKAYKKKNGGLSDARNYGIKKAEGEYLAFVDSDDYVDEHMFEKMYNKAKENDFDVIVCNTILKYDNREVILKANLNYSEDNTRNYIIAFPMACNKMVKSSFLKEPYLFTKGILYEDLCLMPTLATLTNKIGFLDEALYYYYQRENSIMNQSKFDSKQLDIFKVLENVEAVFKNCNLYHKYKEELEYLFITHLLRSGTLRFLDFENYKELTDKIINTINEKKIEWKNNQYYKKSSFKLKIVCKLAYKRNFFLLRILKKLKG